MTQAIAGKPVPASLMRRLPVPRCRIDEALPDLDPREVEASRYCYATAEGLARRRLHGLQDAVRAREKAIAVAVEAGA